MKKRTSILLILVAMVSVLLMSSLSAIAAKQITITYWADPRFQNMVGKEALTPNPGDYEKLQAQEFMKLHPEVKVEVQALAWEDISTKVLAAIAAGKPPDVLKDYLGRTARYAHEGLLEPLEKLIPKEELDDYLPSFIRMYTINRHLHALPAFAWTAIMVGNRAVWSAAGAAGLLPPADNPRWTIDEFKKALSAIAKPNKVWPLGLLVPKDGQSDYCYLGFFWGMGAKVYNEGDYSKVSLNSPEGVKALKLLIELNTKGLINPGVTTIPLQDLQNMFYNGQIAIMPYTLQMWNDVKVAQDQGKVAIPMDLFWAQHPHAPGVNNGLAVGPTGFAVFKQKDPEKRKWVAEFVRFLNSPEKQYEYILNCRQMPTRKSTKNPFGDDPQYTGVYRMLMRMGAEDMGLGSPKYNEVRAILAPQIQAALLGVKTPTQALADFEREANKVLSR